MPLTPDIQKNVEIYIQQKEYENTNPLNELKQSIGIEQKEDDGKFHLFEWLKNDKNLLEYSKIILKDENEVNFGDKIKKQLLELKLSITCSYFSDFKIFLQELKKGENLPQQSQSSDTGSESQDSIESTKTNIFMGTNLSAIESYPYYKNSKTGVTWCAKTAQMNGKNFGINLPSGNAYDAGKIPGKDSVLTLPSDKKNERPSKKWNSLSISDFSSTNSDVNFADIFIESKSKYGHRAVAFKDSTGQWYVLDPYIRVNGILNNTPKKLQDYLSTKKIVKANFYKSNGYENKNLSY